MSVGTQIIIKSPDILISGKIPFPVEIRFYKENMITKYTKTDL